MKRQIVWMLCLCLGLSTAASAQVLSKMRKEHSNTMAEKDAKGLTPVGFWQTIDDETNKPKSVVQIYRKGKHVYGKVVYIYNSSRRDAKCTECPSSDARHNKPVIGMNIITKMYMDDAKEQHHKGGKILDPSNGKSYTCTFWLGDDGKNKNVLEVRGHVSVFHRTQTWNRVKKVGGAYQVVK